MVNIVVVGSLNMDLVVQVPEIPKPGETVLGENFLTIPGGKGANQAVAAARLGAEVSMVGQVGADAYGEALVANLEAEGVKIGNVNIDEKTATGIAMIAVDSNGQNSIAVASGANFTLTKEMIRQAWKKIDAIDVLVMPLETPPDTIVEAARLAKEKGAKVVLNPAPARKLEDELLALVDVLVPNEHEVFQIIDQPGLNDLPDAASLIHQKGVLALVTTLGGEGVSILEKGMDEVRVPANKVNVVDTTAAGDSFVAALAIGIAEERNLEDACLYANAVGALTVTKMGAQPSLPTKKEVDKFLDEQEIQ